MTRIIFCFVLFALALGVIKYSSESAALNDAAARRLDLSSSTELAWKSFLERFSFKLYRGASDEKETLSAFYTEAKRKENIAKYCAFAFVAAVSVLLILRAPRSQNQWASARREIAADLLWVALFSFLIGIAAPIMALKAYTSLPVLGTVILNYESKSVITALSSLFGSGNWFIGVLIGMFSVILPILKTAISFISLQSRKPRWANRASRVVKAIGKWSMADVFVIAIFIAYFAIGSDDFSDAVAGLGLYFFSAYCLLAQATTHYLLSAPDISRVDEEQQ